MASVSPADPPPTADKPVPTEARVALVLGKLRVLRIVAVALSLCGIAAGVTAAEYVYAARTAWWYTTSTDSPIVPSNTNPLGRSPDADAAKLASTILTALLLACVVVEARYKFSILSLRRQVLPRQRFYETRLFVPTCVKFAVCAVCCPVGVYAIVPVTNMGGVVVDYDLDSLLSMVMFLRLWLLLSAVLEEVTGFGSAAARVVERSLSLSFDTYFALRHVLAAHSFTAAAVLYLGSVGVLTYWMRVVERPVCVTQEAVELGWCGLTPPYDCTVPAGMQHGWCGSPFPPPYVGQYFGDLDNAWNSAWLIIITSLTVGYGDLFPYTQLGRLVSIVTALAGVILIALIVMAVAHAVTFNADETRALSELSKRTLAAERKRCAKRVVGAAVLLFVNRRRRAAAAAAARAASGTQVPSSALAPGGKPCSSGGGMLSFQPPTRHSVARLARSLRAWAITRSALVDALRLDTVGVMHRDMASMRNALDSANAKLDALSAARSGDAGVRDALDTVNAKLERLMTRL